MMSASISDLVMPGRWRRTALSLSVVFVVLHPATPFLQGSVAHSQPIFQRQKTQRVRLYDFHSRQDPACEVELSVMNSASTTGRTFTTTKTNVCPNRRQLLVGGMGGIVVTHPNAAKAAASLMDTLFSSEAGRRRQLELCLVIVLRALCWVKFQSQLFDELSTLAMKNNNTTSNDQEDLFQRKKMLYLETRLGAKAILTGKVGPGSTGKIYTLATLQLPACLIDLEWHALQQQSSTSSKSSNKALATRVSDWRQSFTEALASVVEFDGLETLTDPSPRSSLTLSQYNDNKANFVRRTLKELVVPTGIELIHAFGSEPLQRSLYYMEQYYASEIPLDVALWL